MIGFAAPEQTATLGRPLMRFEGGRPNRILMALAAFFMGGIGLAALADALSRPLGKGLSEDQTFAFGGAAVFLTLAAIALWSLLFSRPAFAELFEHGIVKGEGTKIRHTIPWDDVRALYQSITRRYVNGIYVGTTYLYTLELTNGRKVRFGNELKQIEALGAQLQTTITNRLLPQAALSYQRGERLSFGRSVALSREGVHFGKQVLPWTETGPARLERGFVQFNRQNGRAWKSIPVGIVPNLGVLLTLLDRQVGVHAPR